MSDKTTIYVSIGLVLISALVSVVSGGMRRLSHQSIKIKAQSGDKRARAAYPIHSLGNQLFMSLLIISILLNASIIVLLHQLLNGFWALIFGSLIIIIFCEVLPSTLSLKKAIFVTAKLAPILRKIISLLSPAVKSIVKLQDRFNTKNADTYLGRDDVNQIIEAAEKSKNSNLSTEELRMLHSVLQFSDKKIRDIMTPRRMVQTVTKDDEVGPILMDELHKSGYSRFPVVSQAKNSIFVGTLYLRDLVGETGTKKVKDLMSPQVFYVHEEQSISHALRAFLKTHHHLFVVVNTFEEFVGVLSIEDVLEEVIGKEIVDEFDQHDNLRAVATGLAEKEAHDHDLKLEK